MDYDLQPVDHDPFAAPIIPPPDVRPESNLYRLLGVSHLFDPATYGTRPPPDMVPNEQGKLPQSDQRVLGGLADLTNIAQNFMPVGGAAAGAAKAAIPLIGGIARRAVAREAPAVAEEIGKGIRTWHVSPHDFERPDISKVGTGQGVQSFGQGLYSAENKGVRDEYWHEFAAKTGLVPGTPEYLAARMNYLREGDIPGAVSELENRLRTGNIKGGGSIPGAIDILRSGDIPGPRTYEWNLRRNPEEYLDWDKPLREQPQHVQDAITRIAGQNPEIATRIEQVTSPRWGFGQGSDVYSAIGRGIAGGVKGGAEHGLIRDRMASERLRSEGIPGIKYLDQGSRAASTGTSNYVSFNPADIDVLRKFGWAGLAPLGLGLMQVEHDPFAPVQQ